MHHTDLRCMYPQKHTHTHTMHPYMHVHKLNQKENWGRLEPGIKRERVRLVYTLETGVWGPWWIGSKCIMWLKEIYFVKLNTMHSENRPTKMFLIQAKETSVPCIKPYRLETGIKEKVKHAQFFLLLPAVWKVKERIERKNRRANPLSLVQTWWKGGLCYCGSSKRPWKREDSYILWGSSLHCSWKFRLVCYLYL